MGAIKIDLSDPSLYTKVYYKVEAAQTRFVLNYGGAGSSKSFSQHQFELTNILDGSFDGDTLFIRKHATDLYDSCYTLLSNIASDWDVRHLCDWVYSNAKRQITNKLTGNRILFKGLDDPEKLKSIVGIKRVVVEEASQITKEDFLELNRRARGIEGIQLIFLLNPVSEYHWIKELFIDSDVYKDRLTIIHSTYKDNQFLLDEDREELERLKDVDYNQYRIYALGEWGIEDKSGKFAWAFDQDQHVSECSYYDEEVLYLSFDFNVNPITCAVIQHYNEAIRVLELIKLNDSDIYELCGRIRSKYPDAIYLVTGDATGRARTALTKDALNYYRVIKEELKLTDAQIRVPSVNPSIEQNRILVNALLKNYDIEIDEEKAQALIYDLKYVEVDQQNKLKKDRSDEKKKADALDCFRYYCNQFHKNFLRLPKS